MKVLLLDPEDHLPQHDVAGEWDLVVDFGRAPVSVYDKWARQTGSRIISIYDFAREVEDFHEIKNILHLGMGTLKDRLGIDWWDVLSLEIVASLQQLMLVHRLANELDPTCDLYTSRPFLLATALHKLRGGQLINLEYGARSLLRRARHYSEAFSKLNFSQVLQVLQDKFDPAHEFRRRFASRERPGDRSVVLLPSAYISVSRMAISYAALLPDIQFLLVCARGSAQLKSVPSNVRMVSLDSYVTLADETETAELLTAWEPLRERLKCGAAEFESAYAAGILDRIPSLIRWGMGLRAAWNGVFESENIIGCLCADDSNPYTRIPLILARTKEIPAIACHHGAMDAWMAVKPQHADFYLAKSEMEKDYLLRTCHVPRQQLVLAAPTPSNPITNSTSDRPWLVFFTEAYHTAGWREDEVYGELLPKLSALAQACGLELVFKLHPFESVEAHRRLLRRLLPDYEAARIHVIAGAPSGELWRKIRFALTGQSSVVLECAAQCIPVFLCAWLRDSYTGYVSQYQRYGIGHALSSAEEITNIPELLNSHSTMQPTKNKSRQAVNPEVLRDLLCGNSVLSVAARG
jgi:hypothetical protein